MKTNISSGNALVGGKPAPGIALDGYDAVAYFDGGAPKLGDAEIALVHDDATYRFSSKANLDSSWQSQPITCRSSVAFAPAVHRWAPNSMVIRRYGVSSTGGSI